MRKAIIFDIGSVVAKFHLPDLYKIISEKADIPLEFIETYRKEKTKELMLGEITKESFFEELQNHARGKTAADLENLWIEEGVKLVELNKELIAWIESHRGRYTIGALTNLHPARLLLDEKINIRRYFDFVLMSCVEHLKKPDPDFYRLALQKARVESKDAVFIDDNPDYVAAAKEVGSRDILFTDNKSVIEKLDQLV